MRISRLSALAVMATLALAPAANAMPQDQQPQRDQSRRELTQQDLARLQAGNDIDARHEALGRVQSVTTVKDRIAPTGPAGKARPLHRTVAASDDSSHLAGVAISLVLIALVAGLVAASVRTRRRSVRLAV